MRRTIKYLLLVLPLLVVPVNAGVDGTDFDNQPVGPYAGSGAILQGDPSQVQVVPHDQGDPSTPIPPDASGNMLAIYGPAIVEFTFACDIIPDCDCVIQYDYGASAWSIYDGFGVYIDAGGVYDNPDDLWEPLVGIPPSTTWGSNTEHEGACDGSVHTITFVVWGSTVMNIDNMQTDCIPIVPVETERWGALKSRYR